MIIEVKISNLVENFIHNREIMDSLFNHDQKRDPILDNYYFAEHQISLPMEKLFPVFLKAYVTVKFVEMYDVPLWLHLIQALDKSSHFVNLVEI